MKVAIIHDWLVNYGGAERVVEALLEIYPLADIFTLVYDEKKMHHIFKNNKITTTYLQKFPKATKLYTKFLPLMPFAFEQLDLRQYDIIISSSSCCAKGVITSPSSIHIAYIHSPMRYCWDLYHDYKDKSGLITRLFMYLFIKKLRIWDYTSSQRIDKIVANSNYVSKRIKKYWNRESKVIYPPVDTDRLEPNWKESDDFYVVFSRFVPYKRIDLAIEACKLLGRKLIVIGDGEQYDYLYSLKNQYIQFVGRIDDSKVKDYLQRCKALIFCAEEDFGIIPLEVQSCGRPVIAFGKGGALETVVENITGVFFYSQDVKNVVLAIQKFENLKFNTKQIYEHAQKFSKEIFQKQIKNIVEIEMMKGKRN